MQRKIGQARLLGWILAGVMGLGVTGPAAQAQTLGDALASAYRHSNLLDQNRALLRAVDEDVALAEANLRPVLNWITRFDLNTGSTTSLSLSTQLLAEVTLIDFGRGRLAVEAAREQVLATRAALVGVEQRVLLRAVAAFMDVHTAIETVALRQNNVRVITQELRAARERLDVGDSTRTDVAIAEARLAGAQSMLAAAEGDLAVAREAFRAATGAYPNRLAPPPALPRLPQTLAAAQDIARRLHPAIAQVQHEVSAADLNVERIQLQRRGQVTGQAGLGASIRDTPTTSATSSATASASMTYSVPVYSGGRVPATERQAMARRDAVRAGLHQTAADITQSVANGWAQLAVAQARLQASELQVRAARTAYEGVRAEAGVGSRTTLDVLNAEQELLDAQSSRILAAAGVQIASYALLESTGQLTAQSLRLGVPIYDVEAYRREHIAPTPSDQGRRLDRLMQRFGNN
jgi:outer membrane protein